MCAGYSQSNKSPYVLRLKYIHKRKRVLLYHSSERKRKANPDIALVPTYLWPLQFLGDPSLTQSKHTLPHQYETLNQESIPN